MDRLRQCIDALRVLSLQSTTSQNWYPLAEKEVTHYLDGPEASLQKLREAIDREAESSPRYTAFWITVQEFVDRLAIGK
jgi:hypothetical protein